jgi:hypothetical protein
MWGNEKCLHNFGLETEGERPHERPKPSWEGNIKIYLGELMKVGSGMNWFSWWAFVNVVTN